MKTWTIHLPESPTPYQIARAIAQREDLEKPYQPIKIPKLTYPKSNLKGASEFAFIKNFLQI